MTFIYLQAIFGLIKALFSMEDIPFDKISGKLFYNGSYINWQDANIHMLNHGLHYGSCVFEGVRMYDGKVFKNTEHNERLHNSAKIMDLKYHILWKN